MMKKVMCLLATVFLLLGTASLSAQEENAVKKVIPDAMTALGNFEFDKAWAFWCEDGFVVKGGEKKTIPDMKKSGKYAQLVELDTMRKAGSLEDLIALQRKAGYMTEKQKEQILAMPEKQKAATYRAMRQAIRMQCAMAKMGILGMGDAVQYKSVKITGDTAVAEIVANNPILGNGTAEVTYKKINGSWKVYSVLEKNNGQEKK